MRHALHQAGYGVCVVIFAIAMLVGLWMAALLIAVAIPEVAQALRWLVS